MENSWLFMRGAMRASETPKGLRKGTIKRVYQFAGPHRGKLVVFLVLTMISAVLAVSTPLLAGEVVDAIVGGHGVSVVVWLAVAIAGIAIVDAGLGLAERWQSARIGEGLIYDLRRAVFGHVQRMPVAFFTRTRTGALVSRLNNDVMGAQRAFTSTLAGLVTNVIQLVLSVGVMMTLSWQVTVLALVLLPVFVLPARRMGRKMADLQRESSTLNASMTTQMTERFSAPGATLVKLFGHPRAELSEFSWRASRVRDIGVRAAMLTRWFMTSLTLVSALAQALVYGLGGYLAMTGQLAPGTVVALALLLTRPLAFVVAGVVVVGVIATIHGFRPRPTRRAVVVAGVMSGLMGTATAIGGPPMSMVWQQYAGPRLRSTMGAYFLVGSVMSLVALAFAGAVRLEELRYALFLAPAAAVGVLLARPVGRRLDVRRTRIAAMALAMTGAAVLTLRQFL